MRDGDPGSNDCQGDGGAMSDLEDTALLHLRAAGLPLPVQEYRFNSARRWRFDLAYPDIKLAIECEGGVYSNGRHTRGAGFEKDAEKYNSAALMGWRVLRYTAGMVERGDLVRDVENFLSQRETGATYAELAY